MTKPTKYKITTRTGETFTSATVRPVTVALVTELADGSVWVTWHSNTAAAQTQLTANRKRAAEGYFVTGHYMLPVTIKP